MENRRPLLMLHGYDFSSSGNDIMKKKEVIEKRIDDLVDKGYGGIVTNVEHNDNYLFDEDSWTLLCHALKYATINHNIKLWLYDEKGYPSGGAGGLTLKEIPDGECQALVMLEKKVSASDPVSVDMPKGHNKIESVYIVGNDGKIYDMACQKNACADGILYCFISKQLYEGTHAQHNVCSARRYISVTSKEAVSVFIKNTYMKYLDVLKRCDLPKGSIQAFFTDEPSLQCCYLNAALIPPQVDDQYDNEIPLLPLVAWEKEIFSIYTNRYGEDLKFKLHYLFHGNSKEAMTVRYNYYSMISDLYEEAFFKQIADFCQSNDICFSGHILLEENILHHPIFEGNYFKLLRHMHIPGIDMLFTKPKNVLKYAVTPKLVSSIAAWNGKKYVMSEISGHTENALGIPFDFNDILCAQYVQFVLGINVFNSYFNDRLLSVTENRTLCTALDFLCNEFDNKQDLSNILVYYPIESAQAALVGSDKQLENRKYCKDAILCEQSFREIIDGLIKNLNQFHCADASILESAEFSAKQKELINPGCNARYKAIIIPHLVAISSEALETIVNLAQKGFCVIAIDFTQKTKVLGKPSKANLKQKALELFSHTDNVKSAIQIATKAINQEYKILGDSNNIISLAKKDAKSGEISCFIVNTGEEKAKASVKSQKNTIKIMNPETKMCYNASIKDIDIPAKKGIIVKF